MCFCVVKLKLTFNLEKKENITKMQINWAPWFNLPMHRRLEVLSITFCYDLWNDIMPDLLPYRIFISNLIVLNVIIGYELLFLK